MNASREIPWLHVQMIGYMSYFWLVLSLFSVFLILAFIYTMIYDRGHPEVPPSPLLIGNPSRVASQSCVTGVGYGLG